MTNSTLTVLCLVGALACVLTSVAQDDPALELHLDFDSDEAADVSGNDRDGVVVGAPTVVPGVVGDAWEFDGGLQIDLNDQLFMDPDPELSMRVWLLPSDLDTMRTIYDEGGAWTGFTVRIMDGALEFATVCCDAAHPPPEVISVDYVADDWAEVAAVFGQGQMLLYVNGLLVGELATDWAELGGHGQAAGVGNISPGDTAFGAGGGFYVGLMDEFRVYSRMLDAEELSLSVSPGASDMVTTWARVRGGGPSRAR
ncbi:LamG domain-containing protein [Candidatus Poribacteria bacterium]|nr:LamG domain-containing protein [Candidatus Poribacteria bacterium]MBT5535832.1 LamG domain-containing protein [Candidatus Poribacteria bacterium]MBT5714473.1 LamG domain-containing protein [Candidatus Poribacteria bacterium]MBT7101494.1 LamG domain-containing protein [Candidatus Poribacteria bacterium]MBT7806548.1 LamG domain-containing protein [Candidatus Poribacteria bacterium]